jgi:hypothetical protein
MPFVDETKNSCHRMPCYHIVINASPVMLDIVHHMDDLNSSLSLLSRSVILMELSPFETPIILLNAIIIALVNSYSFVGAIQKLGSSFEGRRMSNRLEALLAR